MDDENYSGIFYVMLIIGIVGFFAVVAGMIGGM